MIRNWDMSRSWLRSYRFRNWAGGRNARPHFRGAVKESLPWPRNAAGQVRRLHHLKSSRQDVNTPARIATFRHDLLA
jgi:hypothetical protein